MRFQRYANREQSDIEQLEQFVDCRDYSSRLLLYLRRITHLNNFVHSTVGPMQLASCFIPRTNSLKCIVQLCRNVFFFSFFCATYAFSCLHSFPPFFFPLSFFFHFIFFPLPLCNECLWADRETQSRCLRKIFFFFLVGKHQIPIFETNKSSIESMFKARCRRTNERSCDLG